MTAYPAAHAAPSRPPFFRRMIAALRRKPAAPEGLLVSSGAGATGPHIPADRFFTESQAWGELGFGEPVFRDRTLSEVREQWNAWHDGTPPRRHDDTMPAGFPALSPASAHANAMHAMAARYLPAPPRPVNGRNLGRQPRRQPVYGERSQLNVERDMATEAVPFSELNRKFSDGRPTPELLRQVLDGLVKL